MVSAELSDSKSLELAAQALLEAETLFVVSHQVPDADAYGSSLALAQALRQQGKEVTVAIFGGDDGKHDCIPEVETVLSELSEPPSCDLLVYCDCGDEKRVGPEFESILSTFSGKTLSIDHHITNTHFASLNLVDAKASSTCELIARMMKHLSWPFDSTIGTTLLSGIVGDTGGFRYASTSAETLELAAEIVRAGGDLARVTQELFSNVSLSTVRIQSLALQNLILDQDGKIAGSYLDQARYQEAQAGPLDVEFLVEAIRDIEGVEISYSIRWVDSVWKVSLRSKGTLHDVSKVAARFGGGGHAAAAAFRFKGSLEELLSRLREQLIELTSLS